jgi:FtsP/CotA-like multicopper oxidase with cupredoxin domain
MIFQPEKDGNPRKEIVLWSDGQTVAAQVIATDEGLRIIPAQDFELVIDSDGEGVRLTMRPKGPRRRAAKGSC